MDKKIIERGIRIADNRIFQEDRIWSRYSNDKVNIGETLVRALRTLFKALPLPRSIRALSIGSSNEPQFRILETACQGGLYLLDIDKEALSIVRERIERQRTDHVNTICDDYDRIFLDYKNTKSFVRDALNTKRVDLINLHHSMYYCPVDMWHTLFKNLYQQVLSSLGAMHVVLMAAKTKEPYTTSWLYEYFVGKFFKLDNDQDLQKFKNELKKDSLYKKAQVLFKKSYVSFFVDDFEKFMAVIWMIMLYPYVHLYTLRQREEITEFVYNKLWKKKIPLLQVQEHLLLYRGIPFRGLI